MSEAFDYVIAGAGTAGCVLANRLSADAGVTVALLEAGPPDDDPAIHVPAMVAKAIGNPRQSWGYQTVPQRHVDNRHPPALGRCALEEPNPRLRDRGMHQSFEALKRARVAKNAHSEALAVYCPLDHDPWKGRVDRFRALAGIELPHRVVGVERRDAKLGEHGRDGRFPHCNRARQSDDDHRASPCVARISVSTSVRNAGVTVGRAPNQRANPGDA